MNAIPNLILISSILSVITLQANAQVTIGCGKEPNKGALLDLKDNGNYENSMQTTSKGLCLPRVKLTQISPKTDVELARSIGNNSESYDLSDHIGLLVFNVEANLCSSEPIYDGMYVWNGKKWEHLGQLLKSSDVSTYVDSRDNNSYTYREFYHMDNGVKVSAGSWMLENLRYIPTTSDFVHSAEVPSTFNPEKNWCYPMKGNTIYNTTQAQADWDSRTGILYNWYAATNEENSSDNNQMQGEEFEGPINFIQGICPQGWHLPSDREWNELERAIYNNPTGYSRYTSSSGDLFSPVSWSETWETIMDYRGAISNGHGRAMLSECSLPGYPNETIPVGKSLFSVQGGFNVWLASYAYLGSQISYGSSSYFWTSSAYMLNGAAYRGLNHGNSQVMRNFSNRNILFSVRCKKDN